jgi:gliding motility-associated-like protein
MKLYICIISLLVFYSNNFSQNNYHTGLTEQLNTANNTTNDVYNFKTESITWTEDISLRTLYSSTYKSNDGQVKAVFSKKPVNYYNEKNELIPISALLTEENDRWIAKQQPFPTTLYKDASFSLSVGNNQNIYFGKNIHINNRATQNSFEFTGNEITLYNIVTGIDKQLIFRENSVKYNYVVNNRMSVNANQNLIFYEEIILPQGYKITEDKNHGQLTGNAWSGDLLVLNNKNEVVCTIFAPLCYDANNNYIIAGYKIKKTDNKYQLELIVPDSWINNSARVFPVVIDPLINGPTAQWTGGYIPSCILPATYADSILVTIPAAVTVTGLYVTSSFYADPFTTATMGQGSMYFSTNCANSQTFTVTGPNANLPGTAYLDSFNLYSPLTCCFPESCSPTTFYLRMHLGRTGPGTGCNTTYIRHDPFTTQWPFKAVVYGRTAEPYNNQWTTPQNPICANTCTVQATAFVRYGVAPYTFSHPWTNTVVTQGINNGCNTGATNYQFTLNIPNCPIYCDQNYTSLTIPPPIITDACGTIVSGIPAITRPVKIAPDISVNYDSIICSAENYTITLSSCVNNANINWGGNYTSGTGNIQDNVVNSGTTTNTISYSAYSEINGCYSDTINFNLYIEPQPQAAFNYLPNPVIVNVPVIFSDNSTIHTGTAYAWNWNFGDSTSATIQNPSHTYTQPGTYNVCFALTTNEGCLDTICQSITVIPAEIVAPNVITPNNDGENDLLVFSFLEFYPNNELLIFNRWGTLLYQTKNYKNDWDGSKYSDGTYYYILKIIDTDKIYNGFFELLK